MKDKHLALLCICILQMEALESITVRAVEDPHPYSEVPTASPANLTCFPSTDSSPSVFIHRLSRFWLVLNAANEYKRHNYLCRNSSNISELEQLQYQRMVMVIKVNETLPGYLKPGVCSCVPIAALMPLLAVLAVSIILNIHLLLRKRHGPKQKRIAGLKAAVDDSGSDESLIEKKEPLTVVVTDDFSKHGETFKMNTKAEANNWLHPPSDRRRRLGSTESPLEEQKTRTDTITKYEIPSISFDDGPVLPPQTSMYGREEAMQLNENSVFQPDTSAKRVPFYPVNESSVEIKYTNSGFQANGDSKDDDLSGNNESGNGPVVNLDSQVKTNFNTEDSRGIGYHLPAQNDEDYSVHSEDSIAVEKEQSLAEDAVSQLASDARHDLVNSANQSSKDELVNASQGGTSLLQEDSPVVSEGFEPKISFDDLREEHVADGNVRKLDTDYERFQPDMSLSGRNIFQAVDDVPITSSRTNSRGFQPRLGSNSAEVESPNCCIPSFYNDDDEGFQPVMSLNDRENILEENSIPKIDNFGFQPEISLRGRDVGPKNYASSESGFPDECPRLNRETSHSPSDSPFESSTKCGGFDYPLEANTKEDSASEEYCLQPLSRRERSDTIEEYNIPTIPFGEDSMDVPVTSTAATANHEVCDGDDHKEQSVAFGAPDHVFSLKTDSIV